MTKILRSLSTLLVGVLLFVGILYAYPTSSQALAAATPDAVKQVIQDADGIQDAGEKLKALDSSELLRNHQTLDTRKDVLKTAAQEQPVDRAHREDLIGTTQNKLKDVAETVKEKLNLDEPLPESTKEFGREVKEKVDSVIGQSEKTASNVTETTENLKNDVVNASKNAVSDSKDITTGYKPGYYQVEKR